MIAAPIMQGLSDMGGTAPRGGGGKGKGGGRGDGPAGGGLRGQPDKAARRSECGFVPVAPDGGGHGREEITARTRCRYAAPIHWQTGVTRHGGKPSFPNCVATDSVPTIHVSTALYVTITPRG